MAKALTCECGWEGQAPTEEALMDKAQKHVSKAHPDWEMTPEVVQQVKSRIRDV